MPKLRPNQGTNTPLISKTGNTEGDIYSSTSYGGINIYTTLEKPIPVSDTDTPVDPVDPTPAPKPEPTPEPPIVQPNDEPTGLLKLPDPDKTNVLGNTMESVFFENLPIPTHWVTYQVGLGGSNEFDYEESSFELTFGPSGVYYLVISAEGYETKFVVIDVLPAPPEE